MNDPRPLQIAVKTSELGIELERLKKLTLILSERLQLLRSPRMNKTGTLSQPTGPEATMAPLAQTMEHFAMNARSAAGELETLLNELEV